VKGGKAPMVYPEYKKYMRVVRSDEYVD